MAACFINAKGWGGGEQNKRMKEEKDQVWLRDVAVGIGHYDLTQNPDSSEKTAFVILTSQEVFVVIVRKQL